MEGMTKLMRAAKAGSKKRVRELLRGGALVNATDKNGRTALIHASRKGNKGVVRLLVKHGADVNAVDNDGQTALMHASSAGKLDVVRFVVEHGADVNAVGNDGQTALMHASKEGQTGFARLLVDLGADVNSASTDGRTALMCASMASKWQTARLLIARGADRNAVDINGKTALALASDANLTDFIDRYLADRSRDVHVGDTNGKTRLMHESEAGKLDIVQFLVGRGAEVNAADNDGQTALMYASSAGKLDVARFLVKHGADVNAVNRTGWSAMHCASSRGHHAVRQWLIPLQQATTGSIDSAQLGRQGSTSQQSKSWFISPFEIQVLCLIDRQDVGVQFRAKWLDADVVVKLFIPGVSAAAFADEVTVWRQLRHPNVIKLYGTCDVGHHFFVSEFASQGSLVEHLAACRSSGLSCTPWKFLHEAALGLAYLHERKIVHGDLRGRNILIGSDGLAKLSEFALCVSTRPSELPGATKNSGVFGSTRWQSPERVKGEKATCASDVYSLGLCVAEALTGKIPWDDGNSDEQVMFRKTRWDPANDVNWWASPGDLTDDAMDLLCFMCGLDPAQRVTAAVAAQMLERLAANEAATQQPEPEPPVTIDEFKNGRLVRLRIETQALLTAQTCRDDLQRRALEELLAMYEQLEGSTQRWEVLEQFHELLVDMHALMQPESYQNRIQRLSSTRAAGFVMDCVRRRLDAMWVSIGGPPRNRDARERQWREQRAKQLDVFVSEAQQAVLVLDKLVTDADRQTLLAILTSALSDSKADDYTTGQRELIENACACITEQQQQHMGGNSLTTTPEWFLPYHELVINRSRCIGRGGFGEVYLARWLDSVVVVKELTQSGAASAVGMSFLSASSTSTTSVPVADPAKQEAKTKMRAMFAHEVGVWFGLSHPHVIRLFGACHIGTQFFACEFAEKGSLDKYLPKHPDEMWQKLYEASLGVQYLHARGIVHADLKCNNILVGGDGKAKVTDFGLSSDTALTDTTGAQVSGAWQWVAPECLKHGASRLSYASDIYALGMCVVEALRVVEKATSKIDEQKMFPLPWGIWSRQS